MKYSMVIVDDEFYSRNGIANLIAWKDYGIEIIGYADSGPAGIEIINRLKPDIVLSDIKMKGMTGLDMMEQLQQNGCGSKFIIVSGYKKFEYAQQAIRAGVVAYLLKPVTKEELVPVVEKLVAQIQQEQDDTGLKTMEQDDEKARLFFETRDYSFPAPHFMVILKCETANALSEKIKYIYILKNRFKEQIVSFFREEYLLVVVPETSLALRAERLSEIQRIAGTDAAIGISTPGCKFEEIHRQALCALHYNLYLEHHTQVFYGEIEAALFQGSYEALLKGETDRLLRSIEVCDLKDMERTLDESFDKTIENKLLPAELERWLRTILAAVRDWAHSVNIPFSDFVNTGAQRLFFEKPLHELNIWKIKQMLLEILTALNNAFSRRGNMNGNRSIKAIKAYIDQHYMEDISLKDLEKIFYTDLSYLSRLFKKETGMNYVKYLTEKRIEKAKELLANRSLTFYQIANMIGYSDPKYFSQLFKKMVGMTLSEYRDKFY